MFFLTTHFFIIYFLISYSKFPILASSSSQFSFTALTMLLLTLLRSKRRQFRRDIKSAFYWVSDSPPTGDTTENLALPPALRKVSSDHLLRCVEEVFLQGEAEDTCTCEMKLTKAFAEFQLGWPHMHYVFAVLCLFVVVYKLTILLAKRREALRNFQAFGGPPPHWLFGHVLEVTVSTHSQQL